MARSQRTPLAGKGADLFLGDDNGTPDVGAADSSTLTAVEIEKRAMTYKLPIDLLYQIDDLWMDLRRETRSKVTKEELVTAAIKKGLEQTQSIREVLNL